MTLPYDSCRLYLHLRNKACADATDGVESLLGTHRVITLSDDNTELDDLGLTPSQADEALDILLKSSLVASLSEEQDQKWKEAHPGHHGKLLSISLCDDLTAATVVFGQMNS